MQTKQFNDTTFTDNHNQFVAQMKDFVSINDWIKDVK